MESWLPKPRIGQVANWIRTHTPEITRYAATVILLIFFVSAILPFGSIDAVGHSVMIVVPIMLAPGRKNVVSLHLDLCSARHGIGSCQHVCFGAAVADRRVLRRTLRELPILMVCWRVASQCINKSAG